MKTAASTAPVDPRRPRDGRRKMPVALLAACTLSIILGPPAGAIVGGQPDDGRHPDVGGTVLYYPPRDETIVNCTGSLISSTVFLTAAHCGRDGTRRSVSFADQFDPATSVRHDGTFVAHPGYNPAQPSKNDVAVIVLDRPVPGVDGAQLPRLPEAGLLDRMKADGTLNRSTRFTSVGYGFLGFSYGSGSPTPVRGQSRHFAVGSFDALTPDRLHLSQKAALDDGGTCNGDSGGPNFLGAGEGETLVIAGLTSTGDTYCKATNVTYRLDTEAARQFLGRYVPLP